ncbi:MAG: RDD family protein [Halanaerobiales bacterium]
MQKKTPDIMNWKVAPFFKRFYAATLDFFLLYTGIEFANEGYPGTGLVIFLVTVVLQVMKFRQSTTLGKGLFDLTIAQKETREGAGFWRVFFRETLGKVLSYGFVGIGVLWIIADHNYQGWHDKLVGTVVLQFTDE